MHKNDKIIKTQLQNTKIKNKKAQIKKKRKEKRVKFGIWELTLEAEEKVRTSPRIWLCI